MSEAEQADRSHPDNEEAVPTANLGAGAVRSGSRIGPYKLLSILGEGGYGIVYLAERQRPVKRRVALKIIKPGMDSKQVIARFEAERQALALLDHPNIAHVFNAGTTKVGRPYFVMEYVKGIPVTEHCDRHRLTIEERLKLFLQVCEAVQHAHQKGIIHRDIKPSNILVAIEAERPIPMIIDFGVAKAISQPLTERTLVTEQGQFVGTPEYMSPEQADLTTQDIDTRSDIYSLGVVLYELLTGTLPFDPKALREGGIDHIRHMIREEEPRTPSTRLSTISGQESTKAAQLRRTDVRTLGRKLHGDLDWITIKAMEKDRMRRYQTAHALAEDVQRHLNHEPVLAGPPSRIYRLTKFARKHRTEVIAVACVLVLTLLGLSVTTMYVRSEARRLKANRALTVQKAGASLSAAESSYAEGRYEDALAQVEESLEYMPTGLNARILQARIQTELGRMEDAISTLEQLAKRHPQEGAVYDLLAVLYHELGYAAEAKIYRQKAEQFAPRTAEAYYLRAITAETLQDTLEMLSEALKLDRQHFNSRKMRAMTYYALMDYRSAERDADRLTFLQPQNPTGYALQAIILRNLGQYDQAIENHTRAIELTDKDDSKLVELYNQRRQTYFLNGQYQQALEDAKQCVRRQPYEYRYSFHVFGALVALGHYQEAKHEYEKIAAHGTEAIGTFYDWSAKYVFNLLGAGKELTLPDRRSGGPAFLYMHEAYDYYQELQARARRLVPDAISKSLSPDGEKLAYARSEEWTRFVRPTETFAGELAGSKGIEILEDFKTGKIRSLVRSGKDPRWSPDGKYIAYTCWPRVHAYEDEEVWVIPAEGGKPWRLTEGKALSWTDDAKNIYIRPREGRCIYSKRFDNPDAEAELIVRFPAGEAVISPDQTYVAYQYDSILHILELSSGETVATWALPRFHAWAPYIEWSPDSRELSLGSNGSGLWIYTMETKRAAKVLPGNVVRGLWSSDRRQMVFEVRAPYYEIWIIELDPNLPTVASFGGGLTIEEHYRQEIRFLNKRIESDPSNAEFYRRRAYFHIYLGEEEKALADLGRIIEMSSLQAIEVYHNIAKDLVFEPRTQGDPAIAAHLAQKAIEGDPEKWEYHSILGVAQYRAGAYQDAIITLKRADKMYFAEDQESYPPTIAFIAMALHKIGRCQQAEVKLEELRQMYVDGENINLRRYLIQSEQLLGGKSSKISAAWDCIDAGRLEEASVLLEELAASPVENDPNFPARVCSVRKHLAWEYIRAASAKEDRKPYDGAIGDYELAIRAEPNCALAYDRLGWLQATCPEVQFRNGTKAIENATKACVLTKWKSVSCVNTLAAAYAEAHDFAAAVKWQEEAIDLPSENTSAGLRAAMEARRKLYQVGQPYHRQFLFSDQMVAWWKFDQAKDKTIPDSSGNDLHGQLVGDAKIVSDPLRGKVLSLDGHGDWVDCGNHIRFDITDEISLTAWIKVHEFDKSKQVVIAKGGSTWRLRRELRTNGIEFGCTRLDASRNPSGTLGAKMNINDGKWHHLAGVYDGAKASVYVDGQLIASSPARGNMNITNDRVFIGANSHNIRNPCEWNGLIDDVRIYSYALSESEVKEIYAGKEPTLRKQR
jgi:serine/threonine protein kinase/Flp pilus assembly protein TadD